MITIVEYFQNNLGAAALLILWVCLGILGNLIALFHIKRKVNVFEIIHWAVCGALGGLILILAWSFYLMSPTIFKILYMEVYNRDKK